MQRRQLLAPLAAVFSHLNVFCPEGKPLRMIVPFRRGATGHHGARCKTLWPASSNNPWCNRAAQVAPAGGPKWPAPRNGPTIGVAAVHPRVNPP